MAQVQWRDREGREGTLNQHGAEVIKRAGQLAPVTYILKLQGSLAIALERFAMDEGVNAETIVAEAIRAYLGDTQ